MKKIIKLLSILLISIIITGCFNNKKEEIIEASDALKFKEEYESLNDKYTSVEIKDNNPVKYSSTSEIKDIINNKSGIVFLGNPKDNKSRVILPSLIEATKQTGIKPLYYLNIDDNSIVKEIINQDLEIPLIIFIKDGEIIKILDNKKEKITSTEQDELLKLYRNNIHEILDDLCDQSC